MPELTLEQRVHKTLGLTVKFEGICFRNVSQRFANQRDVLSGKGSKIAGGRFNFKGTFEILYLLHLIL
jgi:Uncharacterized conserved protein